MKVFISYSSTDHWIASKVREDIGKLGVEVFLDRREIESGDEIDEQIRRHLREADEILLLVSPAALRSHWVMMEVGAARMLGKRLVPILVNVSPNELPEPINRHLARDINQIEKYYEELRTRRTPGDIPAEPLLLPPAIPHDHSKPLSVGDRVIITERPLDADSFPVLNDSMRPYLGMSATVIAHGWGDQGTKTYRLDVDDGTWYWADRWLSRPS